MDIEAIRTKIEAGSFSIADHAMIEAFKEGVTVDDILFCVKHGKIIEDYHERKRCLIFCMLNFDIPLHVVIDYSWEEEIDVVTAYIPDSAKWVKFKIRKK